ncbi:reprolysin-like metallopeptidase [Herpetosiphon geysericola]|uniref:reprolysin-like metallopeptidase n=1 Tax=Herpetosiphon geysericola TaxID=70996 RepID=UPI0006C93074|nr:zinc-dependent metalloprotease family protein [Herpetosiphon geysericola]
MQTKRSLVAIGLALAIALLSVFAANGLSSSSAASSSDGLWQDVAEQRITLKGQREIVPLVYRTVSLDLAGLGKRLEQAPLESAVKVNQSAFLLNLPLPNGEFRQFRVVESPIMEPALAAKFPELRTYLAQGYDDPEMVARLDLTPAGFHGLILAPEGRYFIDPYSRNDTANYLVYDSRNFVADPAKLASKGEVDYVGETPITNPFPERFAIGETLRTYRLAMAATGEYTSFHGGTVNGAMAAIVTSVNRVNSVYERDLSVRMVLVANNNLIVYTNGSTDPYENDDGLTMLDENQSNLSSVIGSANYDIGHVFSTGGGGVAELGSVCVANSKAQGVTGSPAPVGDPFDIDYVAHEIGHQFGGNHTFNSTAGSCGFGNREGPAAYEPGSGSTIMAYAGICGSENLQPNSDPYFHAKSLEEISAFITTGAGASCGTTSATGNTPPTANAGADYTIPANTPFELTGNGSDSNGDSLTYNWEQYDLGAASPPSTDNGNRPIFRSFNSTTSTSRSFPRLTNILNNNTTIGEVMATTNRTMNFRLTVRDNRAGGGGYSFDTARVTTVTAAGPFQVTAPNTAVTWAGFSNQTVTWNVANTTADPILCSTVNILFSSNGGTSFSPVLSTTPNDGSESISVPNVATTTGRIKVQCANNIFFDISNANFTVTASNATVTPTTVTTETPTNTPTVTATTVTPTSTTVTPTTVTPTVTTTPGSSVVYLPLTTK